MQNEDSEKQKYIKLIQNALMNGNLKQAAAVLSSLPEALVQDESFVELKAEVQKQVERIDRADDLYHQGLRAMEREDYSQAEDLFTALLDLAPEYADVRKKLVYVRTKREEVNRITELFASFEKAAAAGNSDSAREYLEKILVFDPGNARAQSKLLELDSIRNTQIVIRQLVEEGTRLLEAKEYDKAIEVFERIKGVDPDDHTNEQFIAMIKTAREKDNQRRSDTRIIQESRRKLANREFETAIEILDQLSDDSDFRIDADVIKRKARDGLEDMKFQADLESKIRNSIAAGRISEARNFFDMLLQTAPESKLIDEVREVFEDGKGSA